MFKESHSPAFYLVLGILWSLVLVVSVIESGFVLNISHVPSALGAVIFYGLAIVFAVRHKRGKTNR